MKRLSPVAITALVFLAGFAACSLQFPNFASTRVVANLLTDNAFLGVVATGVTFVIISGGIDLSVGSVIAFATVFIALTTERLGLPPLAAFAILLLLCAGFGAAMGAVIHFFDMPPFIVTLAGMFVVRGTSFLMSTESTPIEPPIASISRRLTTSPRPVPFRLFVKASSTCPKRVSAISISSRLIPMP